ncbi:TonB-dependent receptor [Lewinella sp. JB7]|uniref:TonB-dependent receptor n=1 Tax=Lewinella sp. JB7 TaxID=2962887 RepID=UPI0020C95AB1|nr:TonB-dependent receptor [Lewinella sp. JB7]MCP9235371.1 TonB-dependent receptor [Lewinella sp. JB7]
MWWPRLLFILILTSGPILSVAGQNDAERFPLPRRVLSIEQALILLNQSGADLSYRPDQLPARQVRIPGGRRTLARWLEYLLRDTELTYSRGSAGYLILPDPELLSRSLSIFGMVTDERTGERLIGATVQLVDRGIVAQTNEYGFFTLPTHGGDQRLRVTYVGYFPFERTLVLRSDSLVNLELQANRELPQIIVTASGSEGRANAYLETGSRIGRSEVSQLGGLGGEADPLQLARLLPGVTSGADGIGGIFIRGSEAGHNLVLLDGVPVYGLSHAGGLFSIFSNQAIRRIDLYKDGLPARFGGRIGGVLDVHTRDGNLYENELTVGSSLLSAQVSAEGPIRHGESSFLLTGRYFWAGQLIREYSRRYKANRGRQGLTDYDVYDVNFKLNQRAGRRGRIYLSLYSGLDNYGNSSWQSNTVSHTTEGGATFLYTAPVYRREDVRWGNTVGALRYNHVFSDRTFGNFRLSYSDLLTESAFERSDSLLNLTNDYASGEVYSGSYASQIRQLGFAFDGQTSMGANRYLRYGAEMNAHRFAPRLLNGNEELANYTIEQESGESSTHHPSQYAVYASYHGILGTTRYRAGLRAGLWSNQHKNYFSLSPRLVVAGPLSASVGWQATYDRTVQPVHLLNSFVIGLPSDLWVPSAPSLPPSTADQISGKLTFAPLPTWTVESGVYYKALHRLVAYAEGAQSTDNWTQNLSHGRGEAYGFETAVQRSRGKIRGWLSYTLARSIRDFDGQINLGRPFPFRYDRRHAVNLLMIYQLGERTTLTGSWRYETGLAYSLSLETIQDPGTGGWSTEVPITSERNGYRMPANHRFDLNLHTVLTAPGSHFTHAIDFGLYNVYNRHNPIYFETRPEYYIEEDKLQSRTQFYQIFVAPLLPSVSYRLTFSSGNSATFGR